MTRLQAMQHKRRDALFIAVLVACLVSIHLLLDRLTWTGDEVGYTFAGLGLYTNHALHPMAEVWNAFIRTQALHPYGVPRVLPQTIVPGALYGGVLAAFGLEAGRWCNFAFGCAGLALVFAALRDGAAYSRPASQLAVAAMAFSVPFAAYLKLLYPEMLLFTLVAAALLCLRFDNVLGVVVCAAVLPFLHIRALPLAAAFVVLAVVRSAGRGDRREALGSIAVFAVALAAFAAFQVVLTGSLTGSAFATYSPLDASFAGRLGMQLFGVRHGIFVYEPLVLLAIAGLVAGCIRGDRLCREATILTCVYVGTFVWSEAGESWPGRYWIAAMPMLAAGLAFWFANRKGAMSAIAGATVLALNLVVFVLFLVQPAWFLESRQLSVPWEIVAQIVPVDLNLALPVDVNAPGAVPYVVPMVWGFAFALLAIGALTLAAGTTMRERTAGSCAFLAVLALSAASLWVRVLPQDDYRVDSGRASSLRIEMHRPVSVVAIRFDDRIGLVWDAPQYPAILDVRCRARSRETLGVYPGRAFVPIRVCSGASEIDVSPPLEAAPSSLVRSPGRVALLEPVL